MKIKALACLLAAVAFSVSAAFRAFAEPAAIVLGNALHRDGQEEDYPIYGITFTGPRGWSRVPEGAVDCVARWAQVGSDGKAKATMRVEFTKSEIAPTSNANIENIVKSEWQTLKPKMTIKAMRNLRMDDGCGFLVQGYTKQHLVQLFEAFRGNVKYVTTIDRVKTDPADTVSKDDADLIAEFASNWKWRDLEEPYQHVTFMDKPLPVLGGQVQINVPLTARPGDVEDPGTQLNLTLFNLRRHTPEFSTLLSVKEVPPGGADVMMAALKRKLFIEGDLHWETVGGHARITGWNKSTMVKTPTWVALGTAPLDASHTAVVSFLIDRKDDAAQRGYMDVARQVMASIGPTR